MSSFLLLALGLVGLWWGTELAVRAALRIAESRGLSQAFVGMTIIAIGTDVPEMVMAAMAAIERLRGTDASGVVLGSAVGSCLGQIGMVLGIAGLSGYLTLGRRRIWTEGVMLLGSIVIFALVVLDREVTRVEGAILITAYAIYFVTLVRRERGTEAGARPSSSGWSNFRSCAIGLLLVTGFSHLAVISAIDLARDWELDQTVVGLVLVGLGTSLPELALSMTAIRRKAGALSVGNILGSNVFDVLVPPGTAALIAGIEVSSVKLLTVDLPVLFLVSLAALLFFTRKRGLQKLEALALLGAYILYAFLRLASA